MNKSAQRKTNRLIQQSSELMFAVPQVMAHRLTRMALAGHQPGAKDAKEFQLMGAEKVAAFNESWMAMATQAMQSQQQVALGMMSAWLNPTRNAYGSVSQLQSAALDIIEKGFSPVHKRAVGNARRLGRNKAK
ncbi:polyhydroxyalkanoate granule-associated phasin [Undibacterium sp. TJN25]|uniref:polyhydroxyalkanoate granule-associated phasin n=1 Tax=Undibacterium sp. TJN25 TaxID=3413056 RepID=UPI003BF3C176